MSQTVWIRSQRYDLAFVFGGAAFGLVLPLLALAGPKLLLPLFLWGWLIFFEGSHFWATTSRSYLDPAFRAENAGVLRGSLVFFALPALALGAARATGSALPKEAYGFFIFLWSLYHVMRQHHGFVSIYQGRSRLPGFAEGSRFLYGRLAAATAVCGGAFTLLHRLPGQFGEGARFVPSSLATGLRAAAAVVTLGLVASVWASRRTDLARVTKGYFTTAVLFNLWVLVGVSALEPLYPAPANFPQSVLLFLVLNSIFHNTQYHAIVWHYRKQTAPAFGAYLGPALLFGLAFAVLNYWGGAFPLLDGSVSHQGLEDLAFVALTGVIGHHFYLDGKIWRLRQSPSLHQRLALDPAAAPAA